MIPSTSCPHCGRPVAPDAACCPACGSDVQGGVGGAARAEARWEGLRERVAAAVAPRYRVVRMLGCGGMAGVYLAEEPRLGRRVAIKVMAPEMMADPSLVGRFQQEARTTARLSHPNIVTVFDVDERDGFHFFVMAYVPGRTLAQLLATHDGPLPVAAATHWLFQVGTALAHAHAAGVVHRDVKPGNVLLDAAGNALVTDFGIAKAADVRGLTRTGMLVGTPVYVSPEYCLTGEVTGASDQYSLGVVAYEMLTGSPPFTGPTLATLQAHVGTPPPPLAGLRPDGPPALHAAVERMLAKRPEDRFADLHAALAAMQAAPLSPTHPFRPLLSTLCTAAETLALSPLPAGVRAGDTFTIEARVLDRDGTPLEGRPVSWISTHPAVATVNEDGAVHARAAGETQIFAVCEGASASAALAVDSVAVGRVELLPPAGRLAAGERVLLQARVVGEDGGELLRPVAWSSSNPRMATVTADGRVQAHAPGSVSIFASAGTRSGAALLTIGPPAPVFGVDDAAAPVDADGSSPAVALAAAHAGSPAARLARPRRSRGAMAVAGIAAVGTMAGAGLWLSSSMARGGAAAGVDGARPATEQGTAPSASRPGAANAGTSIAGGNVVAAGMADGGAVAQAPAPTPAPGATPAPPAVPPPQPTGARNPAIDPGTAGGRSPPPTPPAAENARPGGQPPAQGSAHPPPSAAPPPAAPQADAATVDAAADARAIQGEVRGFAAAVQSRNVGRIRASSPGAAGWVASWGEFLGVAENLRAEVRDLGAPQVDGGSADILFTLRLLYDDPPGGETGKRREVRLTATLRRDGGGWVITGINHR